MTAVLLLPVVVGAVIVVKKSKVWLWRGILGNIPSVVVDLKWLER